jgi:hypothetical protein
MHRALPPLAIATLLVGGITSPSAAQGARPVPTPASVIGFEPGADRKLPAWKQVVEYFTALDQASPRLELRTLGKTTMGRPFIAAFISDSATIAQLPRYREIQRRLADPRLQRAGERDSLIAAGKTVVLVTSSIHSTEVGGILTPLTLAYRLVSGEDEEARRIRANTITILVPSENPDGVDIVGDWYRATMGTPAEGTSPPVLYHKYTGHDNNRDWYAFTQVETQMNIDSLQSPWHPEIVNDIHQQGSNGSRIFIPPYMDPIEPNIDPIIIAGVDHMGEAMTWRLTAEGKTGIANNTSYDAWTPARAYMHYHGGIRILTETASAELASPITVAFDSLRPGYNVDPKVATRDFLTLWHGGQWTIHDIVGYQLSASWALLEQAAAERRMWLESFASISENAVAGRCAPGRAEWPVEFVISPQQSDPAALTRMLRILQRGQVEIRRASAPFDAASVRYPAGSYVIFTAQPYGAFAKTLLENQHYPDLHEYPGGPPKRPYDVTAHTLPLLMGVRVAALTDSVAIPVSAAIAPVTEAAYVAPGLSGSSKRRIAIYRNHLASMDEGWTRWVFDEYHIPYTSITDRDVTPGKLHARFDAIIIPDQNARALREGITSSRYPDSVRGGLGDAGAAALKEFVADGGTLITFNNASEWAIGALGLPVKNVLRDAKNTEFYAPGSIFRVELDQKHPLGRAVTAPQPIVWFENGPAFEITDPARAIAVASYPAQGDPLLSGWLLGGSRINGKAALVDVREGKGHVVLFGFRPQYRGQTMATYPMIWQALRGL